MRLSIYIGMLTICLLLSAAANAADIDAEFSRLVHEKRFVEAEKLVRQAIQKEPDVPDFYFMLGDLLDIQGKTEASQAAFAKGEELLNTARPHGTDGEEITFSEVQWLEAILLPITAQTGPAFGPDATGGLLVLHVPEDSPSEGFGLRANDVILRLNGSKLQGPFQLTEQEDAIRGGAAAVLEVMRDNRTVVLNINSRGRQATGERSDSDPGEKTPSIEVIGQPEDGQKPPSELGDL